MKRIVLTVLGIFSLSNAVYAQTKLTPLMRRFLSYKYGDNRSVLDAVAAWASDARKEPVRRKEAAKQLAAVLDSSAAFEARQTACRELVMLATEEQIPALSRLLLDEQLGHYALLVLSKIPGSSVDDELQAMLYDGHRSIESEILDVLGQRRCERAIHEIARRLKSSDDTLVEAAAFSLAKIGYPDAVSELCSAYTSAVGVRRVTFGHAILDCGNRLIKVGDRIGALPMFKLLDREDHDQTIKAGALRGMVLARGAKALPWVLGAVGEDGTLRQSIAANLARELPGTDVTMGLCLRLPELTPRGQLVLVTALSERGDPRAASAIIALRKSPDPELRVAVLRALGDLGGLSAVLPLLEEAAGVQKETAQVARESLARLRGITVDRSLLVALGDSRPRIKVEAIGALSRRGSPGATSALVDSAKSSSREVSAAAVKALREIGSTALLPELVTLMLARKPGERDDVISTASEIARRGQTEEQRTGVILRRLSKTTKPADKTDLLTIAAEVGGPKALGALRTASGDGAPEHQQVALRLLAEWPSDEPMPDLLSRVRASGNQTQRAIALRGYVRMIALNETRSPDQAVGLYKGVSAFTKTPDERRLVLSGLSKVKSLAALDYASSFLADEGVRAEAELAVAEIGRGIAGAYPEKMRAALEPIAQNSSSESAKNKAREALALIGKFGDFVTAWEVSPGYQQPGADYVRLFDIPFAPEDPSREKRVPWRLMPVGTTPEQPWLLDLLAALGGEQRVAYLRTAIWSDSAGDLVLELGSDDGLKVWWNGQVVLAHNTARAAAPGQEKVKIGVKQGWNHLMLKVTQNIMGWGACARIANPDGSRAEKIRCAPTPL